MEAYGTFLDGQGYAAATIYLEFNTIAQVVNVMIDQLGLLPEAKDIAA